MLIEGNGLASFKDFAQLEKNLPSGVKLEDVGYLLDLSTKEGEVDVTGEYLTNSQEWKDYITKYDAAFGDIGTGLLNYVSSDGACALANIKGEAFYDLLKDADVLKSLNDNQKDVFKQFKKIDGDAVINFTGIDFKSTLVSDVPFVDAGIFLTTTDNSLIKACKNDLTQSNYMVEETGTDRFALPFIDDVYDTAYAEPSASSYMNFGYKSGVSYFALSKKKDQVNKPKNTISAEQISGKKAYLYISSELLKTITKAFDDNESKGSASSDIFYGIEFMKDIAKGVEFAEAYYEGGGKSTLRIVLQDKKADPLNSLVNYLLGFKDRLEEIEKVITDAQSSYDPYSDYVDTDTTAVDYEYDDGGDYDYYADSTAAY